MNKQQPNFPKKVDFERPSRADRLHNDITKCEKLALSIFNLPRDNSVSVKKGNWMTYVFSSATLQCFRNHECREASHG